MCGGGLATIPAYLRDLFGTHHVSAIHGGLLMAWSVAGVLGPALVNYRREYQLEHGADKASAYQSVLHLMTGLLVVGFVTNLLVRPAPGWHSAGVGCVQHAAQFHEVVSSAIAAYSRAKSC